MSVSFEPNSEMSWSLVFAYARGNALRQNDSHVLLSLSKVYLSPLIV